MFQEQRSEYTGYIEENAARVAADPELYRKRQALVEHPFGTIKRQWGFDHIITKRGIVAAGADFGLIAIAYNLRRLRNLGWAPERVPQKVTLACTWPYKLLIWAFPAIKRLYDLTHLFGNRRDLARSNYTSDLCFQRSLRGERNGRTEKTSKISIVERREPALKDPAPMNDPDIHF